MAMTEGQRAQLVSEPGLLAVGDFLALESRTKGEVTYWNAKLVVGDSTQEFDIKPEQVTLFQNVKKYSRCIVQYTEFRFQKSGMTVKRAVAIHKAEG